MRLIQNLNEKCTNYLISSRAVLSENQHSHTESSNEQAQQTRANCVLCVRRRVFMQTNAFFAMRLLCITAIIFRMHVPVLTTDRLFKEHCVCVFMSFIVVVAVAVSVFCFSFSTFGFDMLHKNCICTNAYILFYLFFLFFIYAFLRIS